YQRRVQADESRKALLRLLPGVELSSGHRYDSGGIYVNHHWAENGVNLAWNLLKVVTGPDILDQARVEEALEERKRLALTMTVMTQVRVAHLGLMESRIGYETALELSKVDRRLFDHAQAGRDVATMSEAQLIEAEADLLLQDARRDLASAELSSAAARLLVSVGFDRLPFGFDTMDTQQLTWALEEIARRPAWATYTPLRPQGEQAGGGVKESKFQGEDSGKSSQRKDARMADPVWTLEKPGPTDPTGVLPKKSPADPGLKSRENSRNGFDGGAGMEGGVVLRVGAFSALENARNLYSRLAEKKYPVTLQPFADSGGRVLYHVSVGPVQGVRRGRKLLADLSDREGIKAQPVFLAPFVAESHGRGRVSMAALHGVDQVLVAKMKGP
ncbi:MAG TPA: TolC family protein, partial [Magnetococcales bacterium]|nr:TolC family protein [Magnetococcales bacterium]